MSEIVYFHHIPGRLRIRLRALRADARRAEGVRARIASLSGVLSVDANAQTGGLLITYDLSSAAPQSILDALEAEGLISRWGGLLDSGARQAASGVGWAKKATEAAASSVVEHLLGRSAALLVAALV